MRLRNGAERRGIQCLFSYPTRKEGPYAHERSVNKFSGEGSVFDRAFGADHVLSSHGQPFTGCSW
jgi:hypothetical protein